MNLMRQHHTRACANGAPESIAGSVVWWGCSCWPKSTGSINSGKTLRGIAPGTQPRRGTAWRLEYFARVVKRVAIYRWTQDRLAQADLASLTPEQSPSRRRYAQRGPSPVRRAFVGPIPVYPIDRRASSMVSRTCLTSPSARLRRTHQRRRVAQTRWFPVITLTAAGSEAGHCEHVAGRGYVTKVVNRNNPDLCGIRGSSREDVDIVGLADACRRNYPSTPSI